MPRREVGNMNEILSYCISVFITQLIFIGTRTWNVRSVSIGNVKNALISGTFVHLSWLISISIGVISMDQIINNLQYQYIPVIIFSLLGGLLGTYLGMKKL